MKGTEVKRTTIDPRYYFDLNIKLMALCGLRCSMTKTIGSFINKVPTLMANLVGIAVFVSEFNLLVDAVHLRDSALAAQTLGQLVSNTQCITKGLLFAFSIEKLQPVFHEIRILWEKYQPEEEIQKSIVKDADRTLTFCKCYVTANFSCLVSFSLPMAVKLFLQYQSRVATNHTYDVSQTMLLVKYPFEITDTSTFAIVIFLEEFLLVMNVVFWVSSDTTFAQTTTHLCLQFKVLKRDIEKMFNYEGPDGKEILLQLVERHRELLRYRDNPKRVFLKTIITMFF
ncbi:hypothetical protein TSAR_001182 [Trichomalopsis sarcophagae]|uniref:Odorant receptor n=1 Tax=Trichomalopsis sarcophagae TaxID=543379 RepID=A0A232FNC7_9HYME|nr:hypothetical protein TSAR_001182 [Trichomalopsis sarcophagae]